MFVGTADGLARRAGCLSRWSEVCGPIVVPAAVVPATPPWIIDSCRFRPPADKVMHMCLRIDDSEWGLLDDMCSGQSDFQGCQMTLVCIDHPGRPPFRGAGRWRHDRGAAGRELLRLVVRDAGRPLRSGLDGDGAESDGGLARRDGMPPGQIGGGRDVSSVPCFARHGGRQHRQHDIGDQLWGVELDVV